MASSIPFVFSACGFATDPPSIIIMMMTSLSLLPLRKDVVMEEFSFVLTAVDGSKRFGFCRRYLLKPEPNWKPLCFCLVSKWFTFFSPFSLYFFQ